MVPPEFSREELYIINYLRKSESGSIPDHVMNMLTRLIPAVLLLWAGIKYADNMIIISAFIAYFIIDMWNEYRQPRNTKLLAGVLKKYEDYVTSSIGINKA
jgi:hypothetical protein